MEIVVGRCYVGRTGLRFFVTGKHPTWAGVFVGHPTSSHTHERWYWVPNGDYLHRNGEKHAWDLIADVGPGFADPVPKKINPTRKKK